MIPAARYLRIVLVFAALALAAIALLNWRVDPLQHYRLADYPPLLVEQERYRLPGLARHTPAETIVAGTSVSVDHDVSVVGKVFGGRALNLAMNGASAREQSLMMALALRHEPRREVVWDIHFEYFRGRADWVSDYDGAFPLYLFDERWVNDIPYYLLNLDTCKNSVRIVAAKFGVATYKSRLPESFQPVFKADYGPDAVARAMGRRRANAGGFRKLVSEFRPELMRMSFEQNCVSLIRAHPDTHFHLYLPPLSSAYFAFLREVAPELIPIFRQFRNDVFALAGALPNATLHDPQSDTALITDLARYRDPIHFNQATAAQLIDGLKGGRWKASRERLAIFTEWLNMQK